MLAPPTLLARLPGTAMPPAFAPAVLPKSAIPVLPTLPVGTSASALVAPITSAMAAMTAPLRSNRRLLEPGAGSATGRFKRSDGAAALLDHRRG